MPELVKSVFALLCVCFVGVSLASGTLGVFGSDLFVLLEFGYTALFERFLGLAEELLALVEVADAFLFKFHNGVLEVIELFAKVDHFRQQRRTHIVVCRFHFACRIFSVSDNLGSLALGVVYHQRALVVRECYGVLGCLGSGALELLCFFLCSFFKHIG